MKTTRKVSKTKVKAIKKPVKKTTKTIKKPAKVSKPKQPKQTPKGFTFLIESDANYPDNSNVCFERPNNETWTEADTKAIRPLITKAGIDTTPIMVGMYSFDALTVELVRRECLAAGMTEAFPVEVDIAAMLAASEPKEECKDDCSGCQGSCGSTP